MQYDGRVGREEPDQIGWVVGQSPLAISEDLTAFFAKQHDCKLQRRESAMVVGHFAIGMAMKAAKPDVPAWPIMIGVGFIDILFGFFTVLGIDRVTANLGAGPYLFFDLTYIDWDHSLLMAIVWSLVWGALFLKNRTVAIFAAAAAFSHFLADWPLHQPDLALYPNSIVHFGAGLWAKLGITSWVLEGIFTAVLAAFVWRANARRGVSSLWSILLLLMLFLIVSPWLSPMYFAATLQESAQTWAAAALIIGTFLGTGIQFAWLIDRAEKQAVPA